MGAIYIYQMITHAHAQKRNKISDFYSLVRSVEFKDDRRPPIGGRRRVTSGDELLKSNGERSGDYPCRRNELTLISSEQNVLEAFIHYHDSFPDFLQNETEPPNETLAFPLSPQSGTQVFSPKVTEHIYAQILKTEPSNATLSSPLSPQTETQVFPHNVTQHTDKEPSNKTPSKPNQAEEKISRKSIIGVTKNELQKASSTDNFGLQRKTSS
ncbi:hypothetical protein YC2023_014688 [Brassica napus]